MSVSARKKNGREYWLVELSRDAGQYRRRRWLSRSKHRKRDALAIEREMIADYELARGGGPVDPRRTITADDVLETHAPVDDETKPKVRRGVSFGDFAREYLALQNPERSDIVNKERNLRLHLLPVFGSWRLEEITRRDIDCFRAALRTSPAGRRRRPKTINNVLATLRAMLNVAHAYELIDRTPVVVTEKDPKRDPEYLDFDEARLFLMASPLEWRTLFRFAIATGLRRGEFLELRWSDVNFSRRVVRVARAARKFRGVWAAKSTKGGRPRSVPLDLDAALVRALLRHRGGPSPSRPDALVFPGRAGEYLDDQQLYRVVVATGVRAGLGKRVRPHMLRHSFASHCAMAGVPARLIQEWMGHESFSTTERYAHVNPSFGAEHISAVAALR